jgi:hypothetical protein
MTPTTTAGPDPAARSVLFLTSPCLWPNWPYLPVVRRRPGRAEELGVVIDLWRACGLPGYSATVFVANMFELPRAVADVLALPKEVYDTAAEVAAAGWHVD